MSDRRSFLRMAGGAIAAAAAAGCGPSESTPAPGSAPEAAPAPPAEPGTVRVASVPTAVEGDVLPGLAKAFEEERGLRVEVTSTSSVYLAARAGRADLVVSHYGHRDAEGF